MSETTPDAKEKPESSWLAWANRTTAIVAVLAALSSGQWGAANLAAILEQGKVNDGWAYYQAKSIKQHTAEEISALAAALAANNPNTEALVKKLNVEAAREKEEKAEQFEQAQAYQAQRDRMVERGFWFQISFALLQLGVVLCTVATGAQKKPAWIAAILCGLLGLAIFLNGLHPLLHAPRAWYQSTAEKMENKVPKPQ